MKQRHPQLSLGFGSAEADNPWRDGAELPYLGARLVLSLGGSGATAQRIGDTLALSLPPQAAPRQIQDRAEAWLREEALRVLQDLLNRKSAQAGRRPPRLALSFAARGDWIDTRDPDCLRCNWRLIEQPLPVIEQAAARAVAALPPDQPALDLFGIPTAP